jgi:hypothetical protein
MKGFTMSKDKKEEKPKYETPVIVRFDQLEKADGAGDSCVTGSAVLTCITGSIATQNCITGGAGKLPG